MIKYNVMLPAVALKRVVLLPEKVMHFDISRPHSILAVESAMVEKQKIFVVTQCNEDAEEPELDDLYRYGCITEVKQIIKMPKGIVRVLVIGRKRGYLENLHNELDYMIADVREVDDIVPELVAEGEEISDEDREDRLAYKKVADTAKMRELKEVFKTYATTTPSVKKETINYVKDLTDISRLVDIVAANCALDYIELQEILEEVEFENRYALLLIKLMDEIQINTMKETIHIKVKANMDKTQKEYYMREQIKVMREELGEDTTDDEVEELKTAIENLEAHDEVKNKLRKEMKRFSKLHPGSAEVGVIRTYIETLLEMPWDKKTIDSINLKQAKTVLDEEHYGLEEVKDRILEFLAVKALTHKGCSPILCLVGPPGTGKTSIAKSLANAMEKKYVRISLGGIHDEAEIRGHRKTYIGSMPGRIANGMKQAGSKNPLMLLDEIDKVSSDHKGDTYSALLEVLDSEQNMKFRDHYLEVPLDLSEVLFVATANSLQTIPRPLLDRMEVIEINSYTENEKVHIAQRHLIPKQLEAHGLTDSNLSISRGVIEKMARNYTKEAGVRQLERKIGAVCRKVAKELLETNKKKIRLTETNIEKYLGQEKFRFHMRNDRDEVGIVRGLAWTSVGGETLQIEVNTMPGKGTLTLTGQLGNVMKESATAAVSYIRTIAHEYEVADTYFLKHDIHVHVPEGAVPKDGPSAGITIATAILSAVANKEVKSDVAMTGEITLRGRVLPIGGLKEKLLAAKNAGIKTVIIPKDNERDISKISTEITKSLKIIPVECMGEVLEIALSN